MEEINLKPKQEKILTEQEKNIQEVFHLCPELEKIGNQEQYGKYLETIFPESKVHDIVYHNSDHDIKAFNRDHDFYRIEKNKNRAFYFTINKNFWERKNSYPALLNIHKIADVNLAEDQELVSIVNILSENGYEIGYQNPITMENLISEIKRGSPYVCEIPEISKFLRKKGFAYKTPEGGATYAVFEEEQIHSLGSRTDTEKFKEFVNSQTT